MRKLLMQVQGQGGFQIHQNLPQFGLVQQHEEEEEEVQSQRAHSSSGRRKRGVSPIEREVEVDVSANYASRRLTNDPYFQEDNFSI